jgi:hypothetical protein
MGRRRGRDITKVCGLEGEATGIPIARRLYGEPCRLRAFLHDIEHGVCGAVTGGRRGAGDPRAQQILCGGGLLERLAPRGELRPRLALVRKRRLDLRPRQRLDAWWVSGILPTPTLMSVHLLARVLWERM